MIYVIKCRSTVVARFVYESDRDNCLLAMITLEPEFNYRADVVEEVQV